jgi:Family of unknown function (DUF6081)
VTDQLQVTVDSFDSPDLSVGQSSDCWFHFSAGPFVADSGIVTSGDGRLCVRAPGTNPRTGEPMFVSSVAQERSQRDNESPLPGGLDHPKWLVYSNQRSTQGTPGYDARPGHKLILEAVLGARTYGTAAHPFGDAILDPDDDLRLAACAFTTIDFETLMVFDFMLTNKSIYAFYERLPYARDALGQYAAFSYATRVADNAPGRMNALGIVYDASANTVEWRVAGSVVAKVQGLGLLPNRKNLMLDHGGVPTLVSPRQLACGVGLFTLLDATPPGGGAALVKASDAAGFYFDCGNEPGRAPNFVDPNSLEKSRLFGQGAELVVRDVKVSWIK